MPLQYLYRLAVACPGLIQHVVESEGRGPTREVARQLIRVTRVARGDRLPPWHRYPFPATALVIIDAHITCSRGRRCQQEVMLVMA